MIKVPASRNVTVGAVRLGDFRTSETEAAVVVLILGLGGLEPWGLYIHVYLYINMHIHI